MNDPQSTRLESVDDIRRWQRARHQPVTAELVDTGHDDTKQFVPRRRPPLAMVCLLDDGKKTGEWVRVRSASLTIGRDRSKADIAIEFDAGISSRHLEISARSSRKGTWQWWVRDLNSTNGSFARISTAVLEHHQDILVGATRLRFIAPQVAESNVLPENGGQAKRTEQWQALAEADINFHTAELQFIDRQPHESLPLKGTEALIGRDPAKCDIVIPDDPFVSRVHAKMVIDERGQWQVQNLGSVNGTWVRIDELPVHRRGEFQIGEQRLIVRIIERHGRDSS